jgi:hypothetical protein
MALIVTSLGSAPGLAQASQMRPTAASVLRATHRALSAQSSVHLAVTSKSGNVRGSIAEDMSKTTGIETLTTGHERVTIELTPSYVYLSGNPSGLRTKMGLTRAQQRKVRTRWIRIKSGSRQYRGYKSILTMPVLAEMLPLAHGATLSRNVRNRDFELRWSYAATGSKPRTVVTLSVSSKRQSLPVMQLTTSAAGSFRRTYSKWGETFNVPVPPASDTIAYARVFG